jgi:small subunit ribosomal protein S20
MPITKSAKKALRSSARKQAVNNRRKTALKETVKAVKKSVTKKDVKQAEAELAKAYQAIDKAAKRGVIKKNAAARKKSRLVKMIRKVK